MKREVPLKGRNVSALLTFHHDLKDFLAAGNSGGRVTYPLMRRASIKDVIEALGLPHTEVGGITAFGHEIDFSHLLQPGDCVDIFPPRIPICVTCPSRLRPDPFPNERFVVDVNVGKLAAYLRMLGFDTAYHHSWRDARIARLAEEEQRIVLTKDTNLLKRSSVVYGRWLRAVHPEEQLIEVIHVFGLKGPYTLFSRCLECNEVLVEVEKERILHRLEPKTKKYFDNFRICPSCERIYWQGSHHEKMKSRLRSLGIITS